MNDNSSNPNNAHLNNPMLSFLQMAAVASKDTWFSIHHRVWFQDGRQPIFPGNAHQSVYTAMRDANYWAQKGCCVYLAQGMFRSPGEQKPGLPYPSAIRQEPNLVACKNLYMDMDVKEGAYGSTNEAFGALKDFTIKAKLPMPTIIVASGNGGLHVYWTLDTEFEPKEFRRMAAQLVAAGIQYGLLFDRQCTSDAIRLLRVPDTWNFKGGPDVEAKPVTLRYLNPPEIGIEVMRKALAPYKTIIVHPASRSKSKSAGPNDDLSGGMGREFPPANIDEVAKHCPFIKNTLDAGGANLVAEPQWFLATALAQYCAEPLQTAIRLCGKGQNATPEGIEAKLTECQRQRERRETIGPPMCEKIALERAECAACPHLKLGTTPLNVVALVANKPLVTPTGTIVNPLRGKGVYARVHDYLPGTHIFSYDEFACRMFIDGGDWNEETTIQLLDEYIGKHPLNKEPTLKTIEQAAFSLSRTNKFNSVADYLNGLKWDGVKRIDTWLIKYCGAEDTLLNRGISRKFMISFVKRPLQPGCKLDTMLVQEGKQGRGKSSIFARLAGSPERFYDGPIIHENGKEQQSLLQGIWAVEIAELSDFKRGDINKVNSFLSRTHDRARVLYTNIAINRPRTCVIAGTTNEHKYLLNDENRRFWCVVIGAIDLIALEQDRDQLLAEAVAAFKHGEDAILPKVLWGAAAEMQQQRRIRDDWEDLLASALEYPPSKSNSGIHKPTIEEIVYKTRKVLFVPSVTLSTQVLGLAARDMRGMTSHRLAAVMRRLGWLNKQILGKGRGYIHALPDETFPDDWRDSDTTEDPAQNDGLAAVKTEPPGLLH